MMRQAAKRLCAQVMPRRLLLVRGDGRQPRVALTFDDGPHPAYTDSLLQVLREQAIKATFFVVGQEVAKHPQLARAMVQDGHALGNHSLSHRRPDQLSGSDWLTELDEAARVIHQETGVATRLFRPPYGRVTWPLWRQVLRRSWTLVLWSLDSGDARANGSAAALRQRLGAARRGDVILLHEDSRLTADSLTMLITDLKARGLSFATVPELLGDV